MLRKFFKLSQNKTDFWFIHIPKNAGTSVVNALGIKPVSHITVDEILRTEKRKIFLDSYSFCIVRHPYERFSSLYNYSRMVESYYHNNLNPEDSIYGKHLDYEKLKNASIRDCVDLLIAGELKHDLTWNQWMPQYTWVLDSNSKIINVSKVYYLDKLDELVLDFKKLFNLSLNIPKLNTSKDIIELNDDVKLKLQEYYRLDFELFNFKT